MAKLWVSLANPAVVIYSSRRRYTRLVSDWSSDVCSSDLQRADPDGGRAGRRRGAAADGDEADGDQRACGLETARSEERRVGKEWRAGRPAERSTKRVRTM